MTAPRPGAVTSAYPGRSLAVVAQLFGLLTFLSLLRFWIVIAALVPTLLVLLALRTQGRWLERVATEVREAFNFQLTAVIVLLVIEIPESVVGQTIVDPRQQAAGTEVFLGLNILNFLVTVVAMVLAVVGAVRVARGRSYRYPLTVRVVH